MVRLAGLDNISSATTSNHNTGPISPSTPGPSRAFTGQIISPSKQQQFQNPEMPMEVEESNDKQCTSGVDVDSGIENMEVEESDRKDSKSRSRVSIIHNFMDRDTLIVIIIAVSFSDYKF